MLPQTPPSFGEYISSANVEQYINIVCNDDLFTALDTDKDNFVSCKEFMSLDDNRDGFISQEEIEKVGQKPKSWETEMDEWRASRAGMYNDLAGHPISSKSAFDGELDWSGIQAMPTEELRMKNDSLRREIAQLRTRVATARAASPAYRQVN